MSETETTAAQPATPPCATKLATVKPNDDTTFLIATSAVYVGVPGDLAVVGLDDPAPTVLRAVPAGSWLPISVKQIRANGTTASAIVAAW